MKIKIKYFLLGLIGLHAFLCVCMGFNSTQDIARIKNLLKRINQIVNSGKTEITYVANKDSVWIRTDSTSAINIIEESGEIALVYVHKRNIIKVLIQVQSPSGDWRSISEYYFYEDGKTAFVFQKQETFQGYDFENQRDLPPGPYIIEKRIYFDKSGKEIHTLKDVYFASNHKSINAKFVREVDLEIYKNVKSLPFMHLIRIKNR